MPASDPLSRIQAAVQRLGRRANLPRLHEHFATRSGVAIDRGAYAALVRMADRGPERITDLARALGVEPSTVSRHVQGLESLGYARRDTDPDDRRVSLVTATDAGRTALDRFQEARAEMLAEALSGWDPHDVEALSTLLDRFVTGLVEFSDGLRPERGDE